MIENELRSICPIQGSFTSRNGNKSRHVTLFQRLICIFTHKRFCFCQSSRTVSVWHNSGDSHETIGYEPI